MTVQPRRFDYYVGVPEPSWLNHSDEVPKFISAARLDRLVTREERWPVRSSPGWAIDSGAYIALSGTNRQSPWWLDAETYASKILSFATDSGWPPDFVAPQDWPCEPSVRKVTGATVREHQQLTLENYLFLVDEWPWLPWIPVLQGWDADDYRVHERMYLDAGVDLAGAHRVGVGSICRRGHLPEIVEVIGQFAESGYRLHGFGIKTTALPVIGHLLRSADSMAWSYHARRNHLKLPECEHRGDCRNCYRYALKWREQAIESMTTKEPTMTASTVTRKIKFASSARVDAVAGPDVKPGEKFRCPVAACGRQAKLKRDGKVAAHAMFGRQPCDLVGKEIPADVQVDVPERRHAVVAKEKAAFQDLLAGFDDVLTSILSGSELVAEPSRSALGVVYWSDDYHTRRAVHPPSAVVKRVDELQGHEVIVSDNHLTPGLHLWSAPAEREDLPKSSDGDAMYLVHGLRDGERPGEDHLLRGSQEVTVVPVTEPISWSPAHFDLLDNRMRVFSKAQPDVGLKVERVTRSGLHIKGRFEVLTWDEIAGHKTYGTHHTRPGFCLNSRAMEDTERYYGWKNGEHTFKPTFPGALRCEVCCGSIRSKLHVGILNANFQQFERMRMDVLRPGQTWQGRKLAIAALDRYVRGVPLIRRSDKHDVDLVLVCPVEECGVMLDGWTTVRGAREGWFKHCAEKHDPDDGLAPMWRRGWTPAWPDGEWPVEASIVFEPEQGLAQRGNLFRTATVTVLEPTDDPSWAALVARFEGEGRSMSVKPVDVQVMRRRPERTIMFNEGKAWASALKHALVRAGVPARDIKVEEASEPTRIPLSEALATVWPKTEMELSRGAVRDPAKVFVHLDKPGVDELLFDTREAESGRVKAVVVNDFSGKAVVLGPFDSPAAAEVWWSAPYNRMKQDTSTHLVVLPFDADPERKPAVAVHGSDPYPVVVQESLFDLDAFVDDMRETFGAADVQAGGVPAVPARVVATGSFVAVPRSLPERAALPQDTVVVLNRTKVGGDWHVVNWNLPIQSFCWATTTGVVAADRRTPANLDGRDDARYGLASEATCRQCRSSFGQASRESLPWQILEPMKAERRADRDERAEAAAERRRVADAEGPGTRSS